MNTFAKFALAASAVIVCAVGQAADVPSRTVNFADLDLSTSSGAKVLYTRIQNAASSVCHELVPPQNGPSAIENGKCRATLIDAAVRDVNRPELTALHQGRSRSMTASR